MPIDPNLIQTLRSENLSESSVLRNPIEQFQRWYSAIESTGIDMPDAMTVATVTRTGRPAARMALLKGIDKGGFLFYTNYESAKAKELAENPFVSLVFYWKEAERQVRISGSVEKMSREISEAYFATRPYDSRIGAWASEQSSIISGRQVLEERYEDFRRKYPGDDVPCPPFWGGYRVIPDEIEFWQGRTGRLHDRILFRLKGSDWEIVRLAP